MSFDPYQEASNSSNISISSAAEAADDVSEVLSTVRNGRYVDTGCGPPMTPLIAENAPIWSPSSTPSTHLLGREEAISARSYLHRRFASSLSVPDGPYDESPVLPYHSSMLISVFPRGFCRHFDPCTSGVELELHQRHGSGDFGRVPFHHTSADEIANHDMSMGERHVAFKLSTMNDSVVSAAGVSYAHTESSSASSASLVFYTPLLGPHEMGGRVFPMPGAGAREGLRQDRVLSPASTGVARYSNLSTSLNPNGGPPREASPAGVAGAHGSPTAYSDPPDPLFFPSFLPYSQGLGESVQQTEDSTSHLRPSSYSSAPIKGPEYSVSLSMPQHRRSKATQQWMKAKRAVQGSATAAALQLKCNKTRTQLCDSSDHPSVNLNPKSEPHAAKRVAALASQLGLAIVCIPPSSQVEAWTPTPSPSVVTPSVEFPQDAPAEGKAPSQYLSDSSAPAAQPLEDGGRGTLSAQRDLSSTGSFVEILPIEELDFGEHTSQASVSAHHSREGSLILTLFRSGKSAGGSSVSLQLSYPVAAGGDRRDVFGNSFSQAADLSAALVCNDGEGAILFSADGTSSGSATRSSLGI